MNCDATFGDVTDSDAETECTQAGVEPIGSHFAKAVEPIGTDFTNAACKQSVPCPQCQGAMGAMPDCFVNKYCKVSGTCDGCGLTFAVTAANGLGIVGCRECDCDMCSSCQSKFRRRTQISAKRAASLAALVVAAEAEARCKALRDAGAEACGTVCVYGPARPNPNAEFLRERSRLWLAAPPEYAAGCTIHGTAGDTISWALLPAGAPKKALVEHTASIVRAVKATAGYVGKSNARDRPRPRASETSPPEDNVVPDFCLRAPQTYHIDSFSRAGTTLAHYRLGVIVYVSRDQSETLAAEQILQEGLPSAAGIVLANHAPYKSGRRVKEDSCSPPSGYYCYITLRF
jgi:hypothetical protein